MPHTLCHVMSLCLSAHGVCSVQNGCSLPSLVRLLASSPVPRTGLGHLPDWCLSSRQAGGLLPSLCLRLTCSQALATLAVKRFREPKHERRPWRIWFLDTSKQAIGMLFIHFANVYLADLTEEDPCSLYLINFLLDATVGMLLIYMGVRAVSVLVEWQQWESLRFGEYGDPLQCGAWVGQCALYIVIMIFEKSVVFIVLLILQWKKVALLNPIENPDLKLAIVMLIVPFFVNALMFWVVDNFLMRKGRTKAKLEERGANQDSRNGSKVRYRRAASHEESESEILISADDEMEESDVEEDLRRLTPLKSAKKKKHRFGLPV
ncbi:store-operated calcium entry regulator STIMATE isoform X1 [Sagmatias obliquidens]|uniref:store-operated calcium entry regulator STIMATE isoform X1 n=1 Tax=Sagmatias obliquidens TaxID=3371155 RepID=UPI000F43EE6F|nr:store-operated calcium entry regulator STIMATE isoform X1 [Lagenorhynchus obliquidens]